MKLSDMLLEPDYCVRATFNVKRVDKPYMTRLGRHHKRMSALPCTKESNTLQ